MTDNRSSGVRNLRAMFESQNAASSPEPRGRSPASRITPDNNRPTSKVRASFVSVEPSGGIVKDLGATKGTADGINAPQAHRRESFSVSEDQGEGTVAELKRVVSNEAEARKKSDAIPEAIPEQAVETRESSRAPPPICPVQGTMPNLGSIMKGSDFPESDVAEKGNTKAGEHVQQAAPPKAEAEKIEEKMAALSLKETPADNPDKAVTGAQEEASLKPADPKDEAAVSGGAALPPPTEVLPPTAAAEVAPKTPRAEASTPSKAKANGMASAAKPNGASATKKPAAISTTKASATKVSSSKSPLPKSPGFARLPKTPTTPKAAPSASGSKHTPVKNQPKAVASKEPAKAPAPKPSRTSLRQSITATTASAAAKTKADVTENKKPTTKSTAAAPTAKDSTTTSPGGFKKPRPKSPTRPVRLPSHLTAPTASSAAKHGDDVAPQSLTRKPSTISRTAPSKATPAARKQPSRASLAPSIAPTKRPESRTSTRGGSDESFLARMMRPTASSASKTHDKPVSPPRRATSVRAPAKPKPGHESTVAKGKRKVGEVASKVKESATNGHIEDHGATETEPTASNGHSAEATETPDQPSASEQEAKLAKPSVLESENSNLEGQAVH